MNYSSKDHEFLGRQVAAGHYITRSFCIMAIICALCIGGILGYTLAPKGPASSGFQKVPIGAATPQQATSGMLNTVIQYEQLTKETPTDAEAWIKLGNAYFDIQEPAKAVNAYNKALEINPKLPDVWVDCGVMYRALSQPEKALEYFSTALKSNPKHEFALFNSGVVLHNDLKDDAKAMETWKKLVSINPQFKTPEGKLLSVLIDDHEKN